MAEQLRRAEEAPYAERFMQGRDEGYRTFTWHLYEKSRAMSRSELVLWLSDTIETLRRRTSWPMLIVQPRLDDITVDREAMTISAPCAWRRKERVSAGD